MHRQRGSPTLRLWSTSQGLGCWIRCWRWCSLLLFIGLQVLLLTTLLEVPAGTPSDVPVSAPPSSSAPSGAISIAHLAQNKASQACSFSSSSSLRLGSRKLHKLSFFHQVTALSLHKGTLSVKHLSYNPKIVSLFPLLCSALPFLSPRHLANQEPLHFILSCCDLPLPIILTQNQKNSKEEQAGERASTSSNLLFPTFADQIFVPLHDPYVVASLTEAQQKEATAFASMHNAVLALPTKSRGLWMMLPKEEGGYITNYERMRQQLLDEGNERTSPWKERSDVPFWKGQLAYNKAVGYSHMDHPRVQLVRLSQKQPHCVHARFTPIADKHASHGTYMPEDLKAMVEAPSPIRYADHKYLVHVGNAGYADRLWQLLLSGSTVLWMEDGWQEWWYHFLQPWQHYVPIRMDASDLCERVEWLRAHPEEGERIAANGRQLVERLLTWENVVNYTAHVVDTYLESCGSLLAAQRNTKMFRWLGEGKNVPLCSVTGYGAGGRGEGVWDPLIREAGGDTVDEMMEAVHAAIKKKLKA
ncbi:Protein O-glucosyltransferase 1 [Balamuthia mandrillaris]